MKYYTQADIKGLWKNDKVNDGYCICPDFTEADLRRIEGKLGFKLPDSYVELMHMRNGGMLKRPVFQIKNESGCIVKTLKCESLLGIWDDDQHNCLLNQHSNKKETGFEIGRWVPDAGWGSCCFYLDYSLCGADGEPRVLVDVMQWFPEHRKAMPVPYEVADRFDRFVEGLTAKPIELPFDYEQFQKDLVEAAKQAAALLPGRYPQDQIVAFGFYTNDDGSMIATAANSRKHLQDRIAQNPGDGGFYTYTTTEWRYEGTDDAGCCARLTRQLEDHRGMLLTQAKTRIFRNRVIDCCANALETLREEQFFTELFGRNITLMVGMANGELSMSKYKNFIKRLNA